MVLAMAAVLYRAGALRLSSMVLAGIMAITIAAVLFFSH
jgi:hypothetical protein